MNEPVIYRRVGDQIIGVKLLPGKMAAAEKLAEAEKFADALAKEIEQDAGAEKR